MTTKNDFEDVEIARKDQPDVRFRGRLLAEADSKDETRQDRRNKDRWTRLAVWELESGDWVAASIACSDKPGEISFGNVEVIRRGDPAVMEADVVGASLVNPRRAVRGEDAMRKAAMDFLGYTWLAKSLYRAAGWDAVEEIK